MMPKQNYAPEIALHTIKHYITIRNDSSSHENSEAGVGKWGKGGP